MIEQLNWLIQSGAATRIVSREEMLKLLLDFYPSTLDVEEINRWIEMSFDNFVKEFRRLMEIENEFDNVKFVETI